MRAPVYCRSMVDMLTTAAGNTSGWGTIARRSVAPWLALVLVAACGGTPASPSPTTAPTVAVSIPTVAPSPTRAAVATPAPTPDRGLCELAIDAASAFESVVYQFATVLLEDDTEGMNRLVDDTVDLAESLAGGLHDHESFPTLVRWATALQAIDDSRLPYLTGDMGTAFIDAVGDAALMAPSLKALCS